MHMDLVEIGNSVRAARRAAGLTQQELADRASVSRPTLEKLENGRSTEIGVALLARILGALDLTLRVEPKGRRPTLEDLTGSEDD